MQLLTTTELEWPIGDIATATSDGTQVQISFTSGEHHAVPLLWLRDNCVCSECRITATGEHRYFMGRETQKPRPTTVGLASGSLELVWTDGHRSVFHPNDFARLMHVADRQHITARVWANDFAPASFSRTRILADTQVQVEFLTAAMRDGLALVTDMPNESGECIRFLEALKLPVRETPFDRLHDVFFRADGYNVAHTDESLPPHNDFASYAWPPSGQLIHMLINEVAGGEWVNVDGFKVLTKLWNENPDAVRTLARVPVAFREHSDTAESWTRAPLVRIDGRGNITGLRFSNQLMQPMSPLDPDAAAFYEAYYSLAAAVNDPANQIEFPSTAGTMQFLHGHRILHARRAFDGSSGARHLQDTYFEFDDVASLVALTTGEAR